MVSHLLLRSHNVLGNLSRYRQRGHTFVSITGWAGQMFEGKVEPTDDEESWDLDTAKTLSQ